MSIRAAGLVCSHRQSRGPQLSAAVLQHLLGTLDPYGKEDQVLKKHMCFTWLPKSNSNFWKILFQSVVQIALFLWIQANFGFSFHLKFVWRQHQPDATQPEVMGKNRWTQPTVLANFGYHSIKKAPCVSICWYTSAQPKTKIEMRLRPYFTLPSSTVHPWSVTPTSCWRQGQSLHPPDCSGL